MEGDNREKYGKKIINLHIKTKYLSKENTISHYPEIKFLKVDQKKIFCKNIVNMIIINIARKTPC